MKINIRTKAKILIVLSIILLTIFSGCTGNVQTIKTENGDTKISSGSGPDWCKAGTKMTQTGPNGEQVTFEVRGIVDYEGKKVCESGWMTNDGSTSIYTNEDSTYNVMVVKDKTGKVVSRVDMSQPK